MWTGKQLPTFLKQYSVLIFRVKQTKRSTILEPPDPENGRTMLLQNVGSYFPVHML
jgi:hypothetical protein